MARGVPIDRAAIVLTRPAESARETALALRDAAVTSPILFSPVLRIEPAAPGDLPGGTLIFTSRHAVSRARDLQLQDRPAVAVGGATAHLARRAGFDCIAGPGDVTALKDLILRDTTGPLLYLRGRHVTSDLATALRGAGRVAEDRIVYDQIAHPLTHAARCALSRSETILPLYSQRSARRIARDMASESCRARVIAISQSVAQAWPLGGPLHIAAGPDGASMVAAMASLVATNGER